MKNEITGTKFRLIVMNFLQFAVWGAYLTSMGTYLYNIGLGEKIGLFYAMQGIVSLFMPAVMGIIADRWVPAQKLLGFCHFMGQSPPRRRNSPRTSSRERRSSRRRVVDRHIVR